MSQSEYAVYVENLSRCFGSFKAVSDVSFKVKPGEIFGFLGANGAGKTTTIRMLCGLLMPSSGNAVIAGYNVFTDAEKIKHNIGYMAQRFSLYEDLTVKENIEFYGGVYGLSRKQIKIKTEELLDYLKLWDHADKLTLSLPLGWKQRIALSTALLHDPGIIFLDEPTSGVDPESRRNFWTLIYQLSGKGKTIFVTTHYMDEAGFCNRLSIMKDGKIIELDQPKVLKRKYNANSMQKVFMSVIKGKKT